MRLNNLYTSRSSRTLMEDSSLPLDPSRYSDIKRFRTVNNTPRIQMSKELQVLDQLAETDSLAAYRQLRALIDKDVTTGLNKGHKYNKIIGEASDRINDNGLPDWIIVSADVDNAGHMNEKSGLGTSGTNSVLGYIGELIENRFGNARNTETYRTGSDSFAITVYIGDQDIGRVQAIFTDVLSRSIWIANTLQTTGQTHEGWPSERHVQPTMSFGISTSDQAANSIRDNIKAGGEGRKPLKYVVVVDSDLRHALGLSVDDINRIKAQAPTGIDVVSSDASESVYESKMPIDEVRNKSGCLVVECSYRDMPGHRKKELNQYRESKNRFLKEPVGAVLLDAERGIYGPLKEPYKYPA